MAALSAALSSRVPFDRLLREISYVLPGGLVAHGLERLRPGKRRCRLPPGAAPSPASTSAEGVTIQGATYSHDAVARVLARLSVSPVARERAARGQRARRAAAESERGHEDEQGTNRKTFVTFIIAATLHAGGTS